MKQCQGYIRGRETSSFSPTRLQNAPIPPRLTTPHISPTSTLRAQIDQAKNLAQDSSNLLKTHLWQLYSTVNSQQAKIDAQDKDLAQLKEGIKKTEQSQLQEYRPSESPKMLKMRGENREKWKQAEDLLFKLKQVEAQSQRSKGSAKGRPTL